MRLVIQRVLRAGVSVDGREVASIGHGALVFVAVARGDTREDAAYLAGKVVQLRIFDDEQKKLNAPIAKVGGEFLVVSQFTLYGDCRRGNRPSYTEAAPPDEARVLYEEFCGYLRQSGFEVAEGVFREHMVVSLENDGPVTIIMESRGRRRA